MLHDPEPPVPKPQRVEYRYIPQDDGDTLVEIDVLGETFVSLMVLDGETPMGKFPIPYPIEIWSVGIEEQLGYSFDWRQHKN